MFSGRCLNSAYRAPAQGGHSAAEMHRGDVLVPGAHPQIPMPKGALARVDIERPLRAGGGTLHWLVPPDLLKPAR